MEKKQIERDREKTVRRQTEVENGRSIKRDRGADK